KYSSGGYGFALRVASPTIAILTALGAAFVPMRLLRSRDGALAAVAIALLFVKTTTDLIGGGGARAWRGPLRQVVRPVAEFPWPIDDGVAAELRAHGGRVLSDNAHLTPVMRAFALDLVPVWSPDVRFLFDPSVSADELRSRLRALHLRVATPVEWAQFASND